MSYPGVILDADDTLWENMSVYVYAKEKYFDELVRQGFDRQEVRELLESTDKLNISQYGFSRERFPSSLISTYRLVCARHQKQPDSRTELRIKDIASGVFSAEPLVHPAAHNVLSLLRPNFRLVLVTKGDSEVQRRKLRRSGLETFFIAVYVLSDKTDEEFRRVIEEQELDVERTWVVGDSLRSDINPALRLGLRAVWVPAPNWIYEFEEPRKSTRLFRVNSLAEVPNLLLGGEA